MAGPALGWPMSTPEQWTALAAIGAGTFCCSAAANALNQRHEIPRDSRMVRTRGRPLVQGRATADQARNFAIAAGGLGTASLLAGCGPIPAVLGFANIALYAGIYTRMKPLSEWNTNAGAIVGGIPPLMGWAAAGGSLAEPEAALLFASLYLWQVRLSFSVSLSLSLSLSLSRSGAHLPASPTHALLPSPFPSPSRLTHGDRHSVSPAVSTLLLARLQPSQRLCPWRVPDDAVQRSFRIKNRTVDDVARRMPHCAPLCRSGEQRDFIHVSFRGLCPQRRWAFFRLPLPETAVAANGAESFFLLPRLLATPTCGARLPFEAVGAGEAGQHCR